MKAWIVKYWKVLLAMVGIFLAGAVVGGVVTSALAVRIVKERLNPDNWTANAMERLDRELNLSDEQKRDLEPIVQEAVGKTRRIIRRAGAAWYRNFMSAKRDIDPYLNPEQRQKMNELVDRRETAFRRFLKLQDEDFELPASQAAPEEPLATSPSSSGQETKE